MIWNWIKTFLQKTFDGKKFTITVPIRWTGYTKNKEAQNAKKTAGKTRRKLLGEEGGFV
jgi:hypothetical protein